MADWLRLAELLTERAPELIEGLGFPQRYETRARGVRDRRPRATSRCSSASCGSSRWRGWRTSTRRWPGAALNESLALTFEATEPVPDGAAGASNGFPIERVLRDL